MDAVGYTVRVLHRSPAGEARPVTIELAGSADTRVSDLVAALDPDGAERMGLGLLVDNRWHHPHSPVNSIELCEGAVVEIATEPKTIRLAPADAPTAADASHLPVQLAVTGGLHAGDTHKLTKPNLTVGRSPACDVVIADRSVSAKQFAIETTPNGLATVVDLRSRNGTAVEGEGAWGPTSARDRIIRAGATRLTLRSDVADVPLSIAVGLGSIAGRLPFNRPPRVAPCVVPLEVSVPGEPCPSPPPDPFSWAGFLLPLALAAILAVVMSPRLAIFAAIGSVLSVGGWLERRRRATKAARRESSAVARGLSQLSVDLPRLRLDEQARQRALFPDPAEVVRRAVGPSVKLWERRPADDDFLSVGVGVFDPVWQPPLVVQPSTTGRAPSGGPPQVATAVVDLLASQPRLRDVPAAISLRPGSVIGVVGPRRASVAIVRSLLMQLAVHQGPVDLAISAIGPARLLELDWAFLRWLPHSADRVTGRPGRLIVPDDNAQALVDALADDDHLEVGSPRCLVSVVDGSAALSGRGSVGRTLMSRKNTAGIVLVDDAHLLPSSCTAIVDVVDDYGRLRLIDPRAGAIVDDIVAWGMTANTAIHAAGRMARLDDPEAATAAACVPDRVSLLEAIGLTDLSVSAVEERWNKIRGTADLAVPIGVDSCGVLEIDLVADGPHLLVGGTTGSGKSELLRSFVAGAALTADPDHVAFVLIDYKGGAAFDRCVELPHVAGMVTDLDDHLAERALRCLEAELQYRERLLRDAGADNIIQYRSSAEASSEPLPRLIVVVDEFATLASELPEFLDALVAIAQRGRSLGVHMVLATQRPSGVVTDDIRANTGARIALRVTDRADSIDVIDAPDAAALPRDRPGRAIARFGPGELSPFQSALVTGITPVGQRVRVHSRPGERSAAIQSATDPSLTDLARIVEIVNRAHRAIGGRRPRTPWPAALPAEVSLAELRRRATSKSPAAFMVDAPDRQTQFVDGWDPATGHLVVVGAPDAGSSTTLKALAFDLADRFSADELHLFVVDLDGAMSPVSELPHCGSVAAPAESDRRVRILRTLSDEVTRRRQFGHVDQPQIVFLVDRLAGLARLHDPIKEPEVSTLLDELWNDGPAVGLVMAASVNRGGELPLPWTATVSNVLMHRTVDPVESSRFGHRVNTGALAPGRAIRLGPNDEIQIGRPDNADWGGYAKVIASRTPAPVNPPLPVGELPPAIAAAALPMSSARSGGAITISFAMSDRTLTPLPLTLHHGEHALVLGPARSGRTTTLATIGQAVGRAHVAVVGDKNCLLASMLSTAAVAPAELAPLLEEPNLAVVLVDDAERVDDPTGVLASLVSGAHPAIHLIVSSKPDRLRAAYGHWMHEIKASHIGVLLRPDPLDGDLIGVRLPPRLLLPPHPGRAVVGFDSGFEIVQVAADPGLTSALP